MTQEEFNDPHALWANILDVVSQRVKADKARGITTNIQA
jgi:hypothetical protein